VLGIKRNVVLLIMFTASVCMGAAESVPGDPIDAVRGSLEKWVETRKVISREKQDWTLAREMLQERIGLVQREINSLREKTAAAEKGISDTHKQLAEDMEENEKLKQAGDTLKGIVATFEAQTAALVPQLPEPLRERIKPLTQRLPEKPDETKLSLAQRFQNVIGILNEINKFNREITVKSELLTLSDGTVAEVTALYVGLGQAYYSGAKGTVAGIGRPGKDGWVWIPANEAAGPISDAIAILNSEKGAAFLPLPFEIQQ
jgi:hypothetical protein